MREKPMYLRNIRSRAFVVAALFCIVSSFSSILPAQDRNPLRVEDVLRLRSFASGSSVEVSSDGNSLAYVVDGPGITGSNSRRAQDIWILNVDNGKTRNLTNGQGENSSPKWSPDGRFLAFLSDGEGNSQAWLCIWDVTKSSFRRVIDLNTRGWQIEWAPDGQSVFVAIAAHEAPDHNNVQSDSSIASITTTAEGAGDSTVTLYRSSAAGQGEKDAPKSDPWDLNVFLRDLGRVDVATGHATLVVRNQRIGTFRLAPDGSRLAFTLPKRFEKAGSQQILSDLAIVETATNQEKVVATDIRLNVTGAVFDWSPDGSQLVYRAGGREEKAQDCFVVDAKGGPSRNITNLTPPKQPRRYDDFASMPLWDKNGNIYFLNDGALWRAAVNQSQAHQIVRIPNHRIKWQLVDQSNNLLWTTDDGKSTMVVTHDEVGKQDGFYKIDLTNGQNARLLEDGQCYSCRNLPPRLLKTHTRLQLTYVAEDVQHDSDLWVTDAAFRSPRRFTDLNPELDNYEYGAGQLIDWLSDDGEALHGALLLPSKYQKGQRYPLVVWVYGGELQSNRFDTFGFAYDIVNMQLLATRGYAVLLPDSPQHDGGSPMADLAKTVLPGVNKVIEMGIADPERLAVMGHSGGGYSTLALIVQTKRFKAAVEIDGMSDLVGFHGEMNKNGTTYGVGIVEENLGAIGGTPWQFRERYIENSPLFYFDRVETPLLIVHGSQDKSVAPFLGDQVFVELRRLGKEVEYAKYDTAGHFPDDRHSNELDFCNRMIAWLDEHLKETN